MTIEAQVIEDSISENRIRLTTLQLRYPRFIHSELMTHRQFSRNASSSRAIPVKKLIEDVRRDPAMPIHWGKNRPGMQAKEEHDAFVRFPSSCVGPAGILEWEDGTAIEAWLQARDWAVDMAEGFAAAGYHKQVVNRLLEPFAHINVVVTATNWSNFFALRRHEDAQPEIKALADAMFNAMMNSQPKFLRHGQWHLPYVTQQEIIGFYEADDKPNDILLKVSSARCARVSYLTHDGRQTTVEEDSALFDRLVGSVPLHASPMEHQATPDVKSPHRQEWMNPHLHGNFHGWIQFRKSLVGECQ